MLSKTMDIKNDAKMVAIKVVQGSLGKQFWLPASLMIGNSLFVFKISQKFQGITCCNCRRSSEWEKNLKISFFFTLNVEKNKEKKKKLKSIELYKDLENERFFEIIITCFVYVVKCTSLKNKKDKSCTSHRLRTLSNMKRIR